MGKKKGHHKQANKGQKNRKNNNNQALQGKRGKGRTKTANNWTKYFNTFQEWLKLKGITMRDVDGDGNCLFRSIADQIDGEENNHRKYRDMALKYMSDHKDFFKFFLDEKEDMDKYIKDMEDDGTWGGHFELVALSAELGVNFCLHMKDKDPYLITSGAKFNKNIRMYHLAYHIEEHYSSIRKIGDDTKEPAEVIELDLKCFMDDDETGSTESEEKNVDEIKEIVNHVEENEGELLQLNEEQGKMVFYDVLEDMWLKGEDITLKAEDNIPKEDDIKTIAAPADTPKDIDNPPDNTNANTNPNISVPTSSNAAKTGKGWIKAKKKKIGPNDLFHCNSGRKLKKCCKV